MWIFSRTLVLLLLLGPVLPVHAETPADSTDTPREAPPRVEPPRFPATPT